MTMSLNHAYVYMLYVSNY